MHVFAFVVFDLVYVT